MKKQLLLLLIFCGSLASCSEEDNCEGTQVNPGEDQIVADYYTTLLADLPDNKNGEWSIISGVGGLIDDATDPHSLFYGQTGQTYVLRWTIDDCKSSFGEVSISLNCDVISTAIAGNDQSIIGTHATLNATAPTTGSGMWTVVSGANGFFDDASNPTTQFTGERGTTYKLRWTVQSEICAENSNFDEVNITIKDFAEITREDVAGFESVMSSNMFSTVVGGTVLYPAGSVMIFKTNLGRYGKLEIVEFDSNSFWDLIINVVTFDDNGGIYRQVNNLVIGASWTADLDEAVQTATDVDADFWNRVMSVTQVDLMPKNSALFLAR